MKLFVWPRAPYSKKVLVAAYEQGFDFADRENIEPFNREAMAAMRKAEGQPLATVPILRLDDGSHLLESSLIAEWIDLESAAGPKLVPADPIEALRTRAADRFADALLTPTARLSWAIRQPATAQNAERIAGTVNSLLTALHLLEERLAKNPFACGKAFSLADLGASAAVHTFLVDRKLFDDRRLPSLDDFPATARWFDGVVQRESWRRVIEDARKLPGDDRVWVTGGSKTSSSGVRADGTSID